MWSSNGNLEVVKTPDLDTAVSQRALKEGAGGACEWSDSQKPVLPLGQKVEEDW